MSWKDWLPSLKRGNPSKVYFLSLNASGKKGGLMQRLPELLSTLSMYDHARPKAATAIKLHLGERGNTSFIRPLFIQFIVDYLKAKGLKPFLTDANTLYSGSRSNSIDHLICANENGFQYGVVHAPVIIADGIYGNRSVVIETPGPRVKQAYIGEAIYDADALLCASHFKGHELTGFGGALKNMGMGCAAKAGKLVMHSDQNPQVSVERCVGCGVCVNFCGSDAITIKDKKARIDSKKCVGCASCIAVCPTHSINNSWNVGPVACMEKMAEYASAAMSCVYPAIGFVTFITNVSPVCDCYGFSGVPIVGDIGILASDDPVAIDQASYDLVNEAPWHPYYGKRQEGIDKFKELANGIDPTVQLVHAEKLGLGTRKYELLEI